MDRFRARNLAWQDIHRRRLAGAAAATLCKGSLPVDSLRKALRLLRNNDPEIRADAIRTVSNSGDRQVIDAISSCLTDPDVKVKCSACKSLGRMRAHSAKAPLLDALSDRDLTVRCCAASALAMMGDNSGVLAVMKLVCTKGRHQYEAIRSLNSITGQNFPANLDGLATAARWIKYHGKRRYKR